MTLPARRIAAKAISLLTALGFATQAFAQSALPPFAYRVPLPGVNATGSSGPVIVVPPGQPNNEGEADFDSPSSASYGITAIVGEPVSLQMRTANGTAPITWLPGPSLIGNLHYESGLISGTAASAGTQSAEFQAQDALGKTARARVAITLAEPIVQIVQSRPTLRVGQTFAMTVSSNVAGGSFALSGAPGMERVGSGVPLQIAGTATMAGTFPVQATLTKAGTSISKTESDSVTVAEPLAIAVSGAVPPAPGPVSVTATVQHGIGATVLVATSGESQAAARGLTFANGTLSGTLAHGAAATLALRATDAADGATATASIEIPESHAPEATIAVAGALRAHDQVQVSGPSNGPAITIATAIPSPRCTVTQAVPGLTVGQSCQVTGAVTEAGTYTLAVSIVPSAQPGATPLEASAQIAIAPRLLLTAVNPSASVNIGQAVAQSVTTEGVVGTPTYALAGTTPQALSAAGLTFDAQTGSVSGTATANINASYAVRVTDSHDGRTALAHFSLNASNATLTIAAGSLSNNVRGDQSRTYRVTSNVASPSYSLVGAPSYVTIDATGTVTTAGDPGLTAPADIPAYSVRVQSGSDANVYRELANANPGRLLPPLTLAGGPASGRGNVHLEVPLAAGGLTGTPTVTLASGNLPPGMTLSATAISGKPTGAATTYAAVIRIVDGFDNATRDATVSITVEPALDFAMTSTASPVGKGSVGQPYSLVLTPQNVLGTVKFENVAIVNRPTLLSASGIAVNLDGTVTGTPTAAATGTANIRMTETLNGVETVIDKPLTVAIAAPQTASGMYPVASINGTESTAALYDASAATSVNFFPGNVLRLQYAEPVTVNGILISSSVPSGSVSVKNLTTGQTFSSSNFGGSNGTLTQSTSDAWEITTSQYRPLATLRLTFGGAAPIAPSFTGSTYTASSYQLTDNPLSVAPSGILNAQGTPSYSMTGDLPPGTSFNPATGAISGTPTEVGAYQVVVTLTDGRGIASHPMPWGFVIKSGYTGNLEFPTVTSTSGENSEDMLAKLYDTDADSFVALMDAHTMTLTYSRPVTIQNSDLQAVLSGYTGSYGSYAITAVDEGKSFGVSGTGNRSLTGNTPPVATSRTWTVKGNAGGHSYIKLMQFVLKGDGAARPTAPSFKYSGSTGSYVKGTNYTGGGATSVNKGSLNGTALTPVFRVIAGSLPEGMNLDPATGAITGTPTKAQPSTNVTVALVSDAAGVRSIGQTLALTVMPAETAANELPAVTANLTDPDKGGAAIAPSDLVGYVYDRATATSRFSLASGQAITYTFDKEVAVNTLFSSATGSFAVVNNDTGANVYSGTISGGGSASLTPSPGRSFTVTATSASVQGYLKLGYGGSAAYAPYLSPAASTLRTFAGTAISLSLGAADAVGGASYNVTGLPSGLSAATGTITGSTTQTGTFNLVARMTDSRGVSSAPAAVTLTVFPAENAQNTLATASIGGSDVSYDLMDANMLSTVSVPAGGTLTFNYPSPTMTNGVYFQVSGTTQNVEIRDEAGTVRYTGSAGTSNFVTWNATGGMVLGPNGQYASQSQTITVRNLGAAPLVLHRSTPHYGNTTAAATVYPHVNANASYPGIPRAGAYTVSPLSASGAIGAVAWQMIGTPPQGFQINPATGALSRPSSSTATDPESAMVFVSFTDSRGLIATKAITLSVN